MKISFLFVWLFSYLITPLHADVVDDHFEELFVSYLLPQTHPLRGWLDSVFTSSLVLDSEETLRFLGFEILACFSHHATIVRHPSVSGYIFKMYLNGERKRPRDGITGVEWLLRRCVGADILRKWIQQEKISHFAVPEKWLYPLSHEERHPVVLIATDMEIASEEETRLAWKTIISEEHLDELYSILGQGYGSINITGNIPYTKNGKFAFVDTEKLRQTHNLARVRPYLSENMRQYWDELTQ